MSRGPALLEQPEARPGGGGVDEQVQLVEQASVEQLPHHPRPTRSM